MPLDLLDTVGLFEQFLAKQTEVAALGEREKELKEKFRLLKLEYESLARAIRIAEQRNGNETVALNEIATAFGREVGADVLAKSVYQYGDDFYVVRFEHPRYRLVPVRVVLLKPPPTAGDPLDGDDTDD